MVVDNCDLELHQRLRKEIEHPDSRLSLLTLDYNPESSNDDNLIQLKPVARILISKYKDVTWPIFGDALLSESLLSYLFMPDNNSKYYSEGIISELSEDFVIQWCKENPEKAPVIVAKLVPLFIKEEDETYSFHPIAKSLIYEFGNRSDVQSAFYSNMWYFSSTGSLVPYYKKQIEAIKKLGTDKNPKLGMWCVKMIEKINERIKYEEGRDEEREIGIF